jgi:uncharacterized Zn finger protein (UPF0148 family)
MPYPRHKTFQRWDECPRCGLDWPKSQLRRDYTGAKVCPNCWDEEGFEENKRRVNIKIEELDSEERIEPII